MNNDRWFVVIYVLLGCIIVFCSIITFLTVK